MGDPFLLPWSVTLTPTTLALLLTPDPPDPPARRRRRRKVPAAVRARATRPQGAHPVLALEQALAAWGRR